MGGLRLSALLFAVIHPDVRKSGGGDEKREGQHSRQKHWPTLTAAFHEFSLLGAPDALLRLLPHALNEVNRSLQGLSIVAIATASDGAALRVNIGGDPGALLTLNSEAPYSHRGHTTITPASLIAFKS